MVVPGSLFLIRRRQLREKPSTGSCRSTGSSSASNGGRKRWRCGEKTDRREGKVLVQCVLMKELISRFLRI